jgi:molybdate transport system permease protein
MIWEPLKLSLLVVTVATLIIATLGLAIGLLLAKGRFHGQELLASFFTLPLVLPPTVSGYYLIVLLAGLWRLPGKRQSSPRLSSLCR